MATKALKGHLLLRLQLLFTASRHHQLTSTDTSRPTNNGGEETKGDRPP
jgi:hypothetical protein